ncbi:MAG: site-specific integrase [Treponema sp.]|jgi:site-specific recombinase XerD|nr:site-specific integrase [Treponema sp.]
MEQALPEQYYTRLLSLEHHAYLTAETYRGKPQLFLSWLSAKSIELEQVDTHSLTQYLDKHQSENSLDSRSVAKSITALHSFSHFTIDKRVIVANPAALLEEARPALAQRSNALLAGSADIQTVLKHANMTTTQTYSHVDISLLHKKHQQYLPKLKNYES